MRVFVCVKQAADINGPVALSPCGTLERGLMGVSDNPCNRNAMELALEKRISSSAVHRALMARRPRWDRKLLSCSTFPTFSAQGRFR